MATANEDPETGLYVSDLTTNVEFPARTLHVRDMLIQMQGMERLARAFIDAPQTVLKALVDAAVDLGGADSAGISVERADGSEAEYYHWLATAGTYSGFLDALLPRSPSACRVCLERGTPQHFRVTKRFFDILGVEAPPVTDGILLPWEVDGTRGTIFVMAHDRAEAFDSNDVALMKTLANFAAMAHRQNQVREQHLQQQRALAAIAMANDLAHQINNPLQSITNVVYLTGRTESIAEVRALTHDLAVNLERLTALVKDLLAVPSTPAAQLVGTSATGTTIQ